MQEFSQFPVHVLSQFQKTLENNLQILNSSIKLENNFNKLLTYNQQLEDKIQEIENQNISIRNRMQEISDISCDIISNNHFPNDNVLDFTCFYEQPVINKTTYQVIKSPQQLDNRQTGSSLSASPVQYHTYQFLLTQKQFQIQHLSDQLLILSQKVDFLQNQLKQKSLQLQECNLHYKNKLQLINQQLNESRHKLLNEQSFFQDGEIIHKNMCKQLQRINSNKSINSFQSSLTQYQSQDQIQTRSRKNSYFNDIGAQIFNNINICSKSLMDDVFQAMPNHLSGSVRNIQNQNQKLKDLQTISYKSISISTNETSNFSERGVQTTLISMKPRPQQNTNKVFKKSKHLNSTQVTGCDTSFSGLFKGILDFATKKIVTNRIKHNQKTHVNK